MAGDRDWTDRETIRKALITVTELYPGDHTIIQGGNGYYENGRLVRGADLIAAEEAIKLQLDVETYPAKWKKLGLKAGPKRNERMLETGIDHGLIFHDDIENSKGTKGMAKLLAKAGVPGTYYKSHAWYDENM